MTIQAALRKVRKLGFSTIKEDGTWYISKPYHRASYLLVDNDDVLVGYHNQMGEDQYQSITNLKG